MGSGAPPPYPPWDPAFSPLAMLALVSVLPIRANAMADFTHASCLPDLSVAQLSSVHAADFL